MALVNVSMYISIIAAYTCSACIQTALHFKPLKKPKTKWCMNTINLHFFSSNLRRCALPSMGGGEERLSWKVESFYSYFTVEADAESQRDRFLTAQVFVEGGRYGTRCLKSWMFSKDKPQQIGSLEITIESVFVSKKFSTKKSLFIYTYF